MIAVEESLGTEFQLGTRSAAEEAALVDMVRRGHALPSQSDAGAHLNTNYCTAGESSYVLSQWVRERELLSLEDAVRRMSFQPARILGLNDRGLIREGMAADLVVFDLARLGRGEDEATDDGPSGAQRRVQSAEGIDHVIVGPAGPRPRPAHRRAARPRASIRKARPPSSMRNGSTPFRPCFRVRQPAAEGPSSRAIPRPSPTPGFPRDAVRGRSRSRPASSHPCLDETEIPARPQA